MHAAVAVALIMAAVGPSTVSTPTSLLQTLKAYETASNGHDWQSVQPLLAEDAVIELGGGLNMVGREAAFRFHEWERALGTEVTFSDCTVIGQTVSCRGVERNDFLRLAGLGPIRYESCTFTFVNGRLARMSATLSQESEAAVASYMGPFLSWATQRAARPARAFLNDDGSFAFGYEPGQVFKRLVYAYKQVSPEIAR